MYLVFTVSELIILYPIIQNVDLYFFSLLPNRDAGLLQSRKKAVTSQVCRFIDGLLYAEKK
jgi:hypothetical protein